ncbi:semaphorin-2A-like [Anneissia japonica]|uniref:semaphorin-2A-like n=1 Tax=Anneissia japonica TaxID=1529436 RepID=UPI001425665E|nr:semaphorin-2A-like [Anneissia japonica]
MQLFQQGISHNIVNIIFCLLIVECYCYISPPEFNLKTRDASIVDKVFDGSSNFRTLFRTTSGKILAGCKNALLVLDDNLTETNRLTFNSCDRPSGEITCQQEKTNEEAYYCQNYIRTIIECKDTNPARRYFVCGTNSLRPLCYYVSENFTRDPRNPTGTCVVSREDNDAGLMNGREISAFNPNQNVSSLYFAVKDSVHRLFTCTTYNSAGIQGIIRSSDMFNISDGFAMVNDKGYNKWLDAPQFVGSPITYNGRIYFFFREPAREFDNAGKTVFSRVAAVCMNDTGGEKHSNLDGMWTTYIKARLNCSLHGEYPFYYNHLQDVYQTSLDSDIVFGVFTTQEYGQSGSALCAYSMKEIEYLVEYADLKGQKSANSLWLPYPNSDPPIVPRPGSCGSPQPTSNYDLIRSYSLVDTPVPNLANYNQDMSPTLNRKSDEPLLILNDVRFSQLVVEKSFSSYDIFYIGTGK